MSEYYDGFDYSFDYGYEKFDDCGKEERFDCGCKKDYDFRKDFDCGCKKDDFDFRKDFDCGLRKDFDKCGYKEDKKDDKCDKKDKKVACKPDWCEIYCCFYDKCCRKSCVPCRVDWKCTPHWYCDSKDKKY